MTREPIPWQAGDRVDEYEIVNPAGFAGTLPTAVIVGDPKKVTNVGVQVILHRPYKQAAPEEGAAEETP